jgi:hypothetical protein
MEERGTQAERDKMTEGFTLPGFLRDDPRKDREIQYTLRYSACYPPVYNLPNSWENFAAILQTIDFYEMPYHLIQNIERAKEDMLTYA